MGIREYRFLRLARYRSMLSVRRSSDPRIRHTQDGDKHGPTRKGRRLAAGPDDDSSRQPQMQEAGF